MSRRDSRDVAAALLAKAQGDEAGLRVLVEHSDVPDHVAGFLAQQTVEKALKAVLTMREVSFSRSHDVEYLCGLIQDSGLQITPELAAAIELTPWAVEFRYADLLDAAPLDRTRALATVVAVTAWAAEQLGP